MLSKLLLSLACLFSISACASLGDSAPDPLWREIEVQAPSQRVLFKIALSELSQRGYPINNDLNPGKGELTTGWKTRLQPFSKSGWREKISLTLRAKESGIWVVRAHAQRQINMALVNPLDPTRAEWEWTPDNPIAAEIVLQSIHSALDTPADF